MTGWASSDRRDRLPPGWRTIRARILRRDPVCRCQRACPHHAGQPCPFASTECDHINPGDNHHDSNLQGLCSPCHKAKTIAERPATQTRRAPEPHPGLRR